MFTKKGFVSLVQHPTDASQMTVRGMSEEAVVAFLGSSITSLTVKYSPRDDYPFQATVPRAGIVDAMYNAAEGIDY
ncbi:hypothetical protein, partial [Sansalvadorimonas verongulae]|uniref:hypothetical protein n=1 Tax=Sansalvadorimonas verongulae TaxID=2172824 RepID=UPI0012BD033D